VKSVKERNKEENIELNDLEKKVLEMFRRIESTTNTKKIERIEINVFCGPKKVIKKEVKEVKWNATISLSFPVNIGGR